jgi:hypothetical protein
VALPYIPLALSSSDANQRTLARVAFLLLLTKMEVREKERS